MSLKVVYLDDEQELCVMFAETFEQPSIEIKHFSDPCEAIESVSASPPDLMFVDFRLPGMSGEEVARRVGGKFPIVLLTGDLEISRADVFTQRFSKQPFPFDEIECILAKMVKEKAA